MRCGGPSSTSEFARARAARVAASITSIYRLPLNMACLVCGRRGCKRFLHFRSREAHAAEVVCSNCAYGDPPQGIPPHPIYSGVLMRTAAQDYGLSDLREQGYQLRHSFTSEELDSCRSAWTVVQSGPGAGNDLRLFLRRDIEALFHDKFAGFFVNG